MNNIYTDQCCNNISSILDEIKYVTKINFISLIFHVAPIGVAKKVVQVFSVIFYRIIEALTLHVWYTLYFLLDRAALGRTVYGGKVGISISTRFQQVESFQQQNSQKSKNLGAQATGKNVTVSVCLCVLVAQSCLTLCDHMGCSLPGSSVHGIS